MGKTVRKAYDILGIEKHPHVHGEDLSEVINTITRKETPPSAWGRHSKEMESYMALIHNTEPTSP